MSDSTFEARTISVTVKTPPKRVYAFVRDVANFPKWIEFMKEVHPRDDGTWTVVTEHGESSVLTLVPDNDLGVIDHVVRLKSGQEVKMPVRVVPNGSGSELMFTVFRLAEMNDEQYKADVAMVAKDLQTLKRLLESTP